MSTDIWSFFLVAFFWGITNPLLKKGSQDMILIQEPSRIRQFMTEWNYMLTRPKYLFPFLLNQCGSALYYFTLSGSEITLASPISNSLTMLFTLLSGIMLGERPNGKTVVGVILVMIGIILCVSSKSAQ
jgi:drug/metabolite transporter (DMT)-like permease